MKKKFMKLLMCLFIFLSTNKNANSKSLEKLETEGADITIAIYPDKDNKINPLKLTYRGKLYEEEGVSLKNNVKDRKIENDPLIEYLKTLYDEVRNNEQENYLDRWHDKYKQEAKDSYKKNPDDWKRFNRHVKDRKDCRLMSMFKYGDYVIAQMLVLSGNKSIYSSSIILLEENGKYWLTNDLAADTALTYISAIDGYRYVEDYKKKDDRQNVIR